MDAARETLPDDVNALKAALIDARARASEDIALIAQQKLRIAKLER
jgi:transposase